MAKRYSSKSDNNIAVQSIATYSAYTAKNDNGSPWQTSEMTIDTAQSAATAVNTITTDNSASLTITTDHSNYYDYSKYNSIPWDGYEYNGNYYLNHYIYNPTYNHTYYVLPNIYNIPAHIVLTEGTVVYATDTNTLYIYCNGRFEEMMNWIGTTYTITNNFNKDNTTNNKQKKLVEENILIMLYFF